MRLYRLTTRTGHSKNGSPPLLWNVGVTHTIPRHLRGEKICAPGLLHAYYNIDQAFLQDPAHENYGKDARIWQIDADIASDDLLKVNCYSQTVIAEAGRPQWLYNPLRRLITVVRYALLTSRAGQPRPFPAYWPKVSTALHQILQTLSTAYAADAAYAVAYADYAAANAANAAAVYAAYTAAYAAANANAAAAYAAYAAVNAANAAAYAAYAVAYADYAANAAAYADAAGYAANSANAANAANAVNAAAYAVNAAKATDRSAALSCDINFALLAERAAGMQRV